MRALSKKSGKIYKKELKTVVESGIVQVTGGIVGKRLAMFRFPVRLFSNTSVGEM